MKTNRRGLSTVGIVVAIVVVVAVIGLGIWFLSDPGRIKMKEAYDQFAKWTPENIAKDPVGYLTFCEEKTKAALDKCKSSRISIQGNLETLLNKQQELQQTRKDGQAAVDELMDSYAKAAADNKFPLTWRGKDYSQEDAKTQAVMLDKQLTTTANVLEKYGKAISQLQQQLKRVDEAKAKANEQLATIAANREILRVQKITDDLTKNLVDMKGAIQATIGDLGGESKFVTLDDLAKESAGKVDESKFDEILKKHKK